MIINPRYTQLFYMNSIFLFLNKLFREWQISSSILTQVFQHSFHSVVKHKPTDSSWLHIIIRRHKSLMYSSVCWGFRVRILSSDLEFIVSFWVRFRERVKIYDYNFGLIKSEQVSTTNRHQVVFICDLLWPAFSSLLEIFLKSSIFLHLLRIWSKLVLYWHPCWDNVHFEQITLHLDK